MNYVKVKEVYKPEYSDKIAIKFREDFFGTTFIFTPKDLNTFEKKISEVEGLDLETLEELAYLACYAHDGYRNHKYPITTARVPDPAFFPPVDKKKEFERILTAKKRAA